VRAALSEWANAPALLRVVAPCAWAALIWVLSSRRATPAAPGSWRPLLHNAAHVGVYAVLGALVLFALHRALRRPGLPAALLAACYGVVDELHQSYVPSRIASVGDVISDATGAVLGVAGVLWFWRRDRTAATCALIALPCALSSVAVETFWLG
jgi:VanZ family protein